jgi:hypothetical protein
MHLGPTEYVTLEVWFQILLDETWWILRCSENMSLVVNNDIRTVILSELVFYYFSN